MFQGYCILRQILQRHMIGSIEIYGFMQWSQNPSARDLFAGLAFPRTQSLACNICACIDVCMNACIDISIHKHRPYKTTSGLIQSLTVERVLLLTVERVLLLQNVFSYRPYKTRSGLIQSLACNTCACIDVCIHAHSDISMHKTVREHILQSTCYSKRAHSTYA